VTLGRFRVLQVGGTGGRLIAEELQLDRPGAELLAEELEAAYEAGAEEGVEA
jgi:hypothetical protein